MNDEQYLRYNRQLLSTLAEKLGPQGDNLPAEDPLRELLRGLQQLADGSADPYTEGPALIHRLFTTYPQLAPAIPRDLLWFLGGDCLHFMPDEEIALHQALDDLRQDAAARGDTLDLENARERLLKSH
jgi:hypothetical protein